MIVNRALVFDEGAQIGFVRSGIVNGGFFPSFDDYDGALNVLIAWGTERGILCEQTIYASKEFKAQKNLLNIF